MKTGTIICALLCALAAITTASAQDSLNVSQVGQTFIRSNSGPLALAGDYLYFSTGSDNEFYKVDVSNPTSPAIMDSCTIGYNWDDAGDQVCLRGDYAYMPGSHLAIVDLNQLTQVFFDTTIIFERYFGAMAIAGDLAYGIGADSTWEQGVFKVFAFNGFIPYLIGQCDFPPFYVREMVVQGDFAYLACDMYGLQIVNISDPYHPTLAGWTTTPGSAIGLAVQGNYVYMAESYAGLRVIDVSNPNAPHQVGSCALPGYAFGVKVNGILAYVADGNNGGLRVVDISNPTAPVEIGWYDTPGYAHSLVVNGNLVYMADEPYLGIYNCPVTLPVPPATPIQSATSFSLGKAYPNPFNPSTAISYQLPAISSVRLTVWDTSGRLVATLVDGRQEAGSHQVTFEGTKLSSGIYLAKLEAGDFTAVQKMARVK